MDKVCIEQGDSRLARDFDNAASLEGVISLVVVSKSVNCMDMPYTTVLLTPKYETLKKKKLFVTAPYTTISLSSQQLPSQHLTTFLNTTPKRNGLASPF